MENSYASTPRVRMALGLSIVKSEKLSFHAHFRNTAKPIANISSFNLAEGLWKKYRFIPLNFINFYACRLTEPTFGAEITTSEKFQFHI